jgi:4-O-beta-D-mannosyl-D-glucose phosphorylase
VSAHLKNVSALLNEYEQLISNKNTPIEPGNGIFLRYKFPILTAAHAPVFWRYDLNPKTNPHLMERIGVNATFNSGAIEWKGKIVLVVRTEGVDRKSFFALAESKSGIDGFRFHDHPIEIPETDDPDTNVYDMRLVHHEDGWVYGLFCTERRDPAAKDFDQSLAVAQCGIVRTKDLKKWERLPDLITKGGQQRNVVLHPEFINGQYALYTRPQDGFIEAGKGGGIGWGFCKSMEHPVIDSEEIIEPKIYHTIKEVKNGQGPAPIKTEKGWLHLAHGVRNTAAGLRYVLYMFMTDLADPSKVIHKPGGHLIAPEGEERVGDVSNVVFSNGWVTRGSDVFIYYGSSDTRMHVATTTLEKLIDYCIHTPEDEYRSALSVQQRIKLIDSNLAWMKENLK